jgi:peptide/nickel transport system permease protein
MLKTFRLVRRNRAATVGALVLSAIVAAAVLGPVISPYEAGEQVGPVFEPPSSAHPLGLDDGGVDVLTQLFYGARTSLTVGIAAAVIVLVIGGLVGVCAGYFGGGVDTVLMRVTDYFLILPQLLVAIVAAALFGGSIRNLIIVIGLLSWTSTARLLRASTKGLAGRMFVRRQRAIGASHLYTIRRHILPHLAPLALVTGVLAVSDAVFAESALSFLGLGDPNAVSWGQMIANAFQRSAVSNGAWWAVAPPGLSITLVVLACALLGRGLESMLNPRLDASHLDVASFRVSSEPIEPPRQGAAEPELVS